MNLRKYLHRGIAVLAIGAGAFAGQRGCSCAVDRYQENVRLAQLIETHAAGEDRILDNSEKRLLLDRFGFSNVSLSAGESVHLVPGQWGAELYLSNYCVSSNIPAETLKSFAEKYSATQPSTQDHNCKEVQKR
jgi:hypothetical protein